MQQRFSSLCQRRVSIGADGIVLIERSAEHDFRMRYFNADGAESEMCGNGARTAAFFAHANGLAKKRMSFIVGKDIFQAEVLGDEVKLKMPWPRQVQQGLGIVDEDYLLEGGSLNTGVPHFVVFGKNIVDLPVEKLGRKYRGHPEFQPQGTNVDFVEVLSRGRIRVRTYERGVENETLSCGTGCVASAYMAFIQKKVHLPTEVVTQGGTLQVKVNAGSDRIYLQGAVTLVYEGKLVD